MLLLGATVPGRFTEQHDIFFGIAQQLEDLVLSIKASWPGAKVHIDAWREVTQVNNFHINVIPAGSAELNGPALFFINLGGYKRNEFDEFHYKVLSVAGDKGEAVRESKQTTFYKHMGFGKAGSHIDDKYGVDVDDIYAITDILPAIYRTQYDLMITPGEGDADLIHLGYFKLDKLAGVGSQRPEDARE